MSIWYKIDDSEDVELSEDGETIDVLFRGDRDGNHYIEIPIAFVRRLIASQKPVQPCRFLKCGYAGHCEEPCDYGSNKN